MSDTSEQAITASGPGDLKVGDWVMQIGKPELGLAIVINIMYYSCGSGVWQVVDEPTWRATLSQCLERVGPPHSKGRQ